jgi:hypothetical protein
MTRLYRRKNPANLSCAEKVSRRDRAIVRIGELLAEKHRTVVDLAAELSIPWNTVYGYLRFMQEVGDAHQTGRFAGDRREFWAAGPVHPGEPVESLDDSPRNAWIVPARQMGMPRDPLVAALFGPAQAANASWCKL